MQRRKIVIAEACNAKWSWCALIREPHESRTRIRLWDMHQKQYTISLQPFDSTYQTLGYDETVRGWPSRYTYKPDWMFSLKSKLLS